MPNKKFMGITWGLLIVLQVCAQPPELTSVVMGKVQVGFRLRENGSPEYNVYYDQRAVINWSGLGFALDSDSSFYKGFELIGTEKRSVDETWQPVWGEVKNIRNHYDEIKIHLQQKKAPGRLLDIVFRVFADGVGFRYEFPKQPGAAYFIIKDEYTRFNLTGDHTCFWIPGDFDTNEYLYSTSKVSEID